MAKTTLLPTIDPEALYRISFSQRFEHAGKTYVPRAGVTVKLIGATVEQIKDHLDSYDLVVSAVER